MNNEFYFSSIDEDCYTNRAKYNSTIHGQCGGVLLRDDNLGHANNSYRVSFSMTFFNLESLSKTQLLIPGLEPRTTLHFDEALLLSYISMYEVGAHLTSISPRTYTPINEKVYNFFSAPFTHGK